MNPKEKLFHYYAQIMSFSVTGGSKYQNKIRSKFAQLYTRIK